MERYKKCDMKCCKKKIYLLPPCRCGKSFCMKHRLPEDHDCNFDYTKLRKIEEKNKSEKVMVHGRVEGGGVY